MTNNPVNHIRQDINDPETRDAYYETEAVIDHYFHNPNVPPFLAKNFIQHFGVSNPSPRYIETVALAFKNGQYTWTDGTYRNIYGSGVWGDMSAMVAAIVLDRESTSSVLDYDPSYGSVREPVSKLIGMMRSLDYSRTYAAKNIDPLWRVDMADRIGQFPYEV